jgi:hypothetical protein
VQQTKNQAKLVLENFLAALNYKSNISFL